jgi:hypothetical protein
MTVAAVASLVTDAIGSTFDVFSDARTVPLSTSKTAKAVAVRAAGSPTTRKLGAAAASAAGSRLEDTTSLKVKSSKKNATRRSGLWREAGISP